MTATQTIEARTAQAAKPGSARFEVNVSRGFETWLASQNASIAITTYQVGKVILFGIEGDGRGKDKLWTYNRNIGRCLGMASAPDAAGGKPRHLWISSETQLYRFTDVLEDGASAVKVGDALYMPRMSYFTGDLDAHDIGIDGEGQPVFVNTLFNCLARPSADHSFVPVWKPDFVSALVAEDRCHLNGLAMRDGKPAFATAVSATDTYDAWRDGRRDKGIVMDVATSEIVCEGLSMPHSPRWHDGKLWLHNSGKGEFGYVDLDGKSFVPVAFCPGYLRGLAFIGDVAVAGLSLQRHNKTFSGLALDGELEKRGISPRAGLYFIDTKTGTILHTINFEGLVTELYDVVALPGIRQPAMIGPTSEELKRTLSVGPNANL